MININDLSKEEKIGLLSQLLNDQDTIVFSEAEFQDRIRRVVKRLYDAVEEYLKEVDKVRSDERKNAWTTSLQGLISQGRAEACARIKTILNEIVEKPLLTEEGYNVINSIKKRKNEIVNSELSNYFRGRRQDYDRLFRFEGKCADALENEWSYAFYLGLTCKDKVTEEQLKKIRDKENDIEMDLFGGNYDKDRVIAEILGKINSHDRDAIDNIKSILPSVDNPHYDEIMNFLKENKNL